MKSKYIFGKLYARPSFIEGIARVVDLGATLQIYNGSDSEIKADIDALRNDWRSVGNDMNSVIKIYEQSRMDTKTALQ